MKILFMGTPDFAAICLKALIEDGRHRVTAVVTQPDRAKGRNRTLDETSYSDVKKTALAYGLPVLQPERIRTDEAFFAEMDEMLQDPDRAFDIAVVAAFGQILPERFLKLPRYGCVNVHASLLPRWRGASPIQSAILSGDKMTGITIMQMNAGLDTGDILSQKEIGIGETDTGSSLFDRLAHEAGPVLVDTLDAIEAGKAVAVPQQDSYATYASRLTKEMGHMRFGLSAEELARQVRGLADWPGAYAFFNGKQWKIKKASVIENDHLSMSGEDPVAPGTILAVSSEGICVQTGQGILNLEVIQPEGKRAMTVKEYLLGHVLETGERFK